jgi:hypothetical protein
MIKYLEISLNGQKGRCRVEMEVDVFLDIIVAKLLGHFVDITEEEYEAGKTLCYNRRFETEDGNNLLLMELYVLD